MKSNKTLTYYFHVVFGLWFSCYMIFIPVYIDHSRADQTDVKPIIGHQPIMVSQRGEPLIIQARVTELPELKQVTLTLSIAGKAVHGQLNRTNAETKVPVLVQPLKALTLLGRPSPSSNIVAKVLAGSDLVVDKTTKYYYLVTTPTGERGYVMQNQVRVVRKGYRYGASLKSYYSRLDTLEYKITATAKNGQQDSVTHKVHFLSPERYQRIFNDLRSPRTPVDSKVFYKRPLFWIGTVVVGGLLFLLFSGKEKNKTAKVNLHVDWE